MKKIYLWSGIIVAIALATALSLPRVQTVITPVTTAPDTENTASSETIAAPATQTSKPVQKTDAPKTSDPAATSSAPTAAASYPIERTIYTIPVIAGKSVLEAMQVYAANGDFSFTGREYPSLGYFVESINGKKNGDGSYWFLYLNGASSNTGASQTKLNAGDIVEWRYQESY